MYKTKNMIRVYEGGHMHESIAITARNGKVIAECQTQNMADKIIKGLKLYTEEERKRERRSGFN